ncbi:C-type lectin domain family 4 member F-like isoform X2 [Thalassophryne amazonica]|uniref:C-type lectin domain family 4 member F-like isoform X2 n=1 Tax=Thalassophryne amazonica TaxID=390379 RepID=UPI00147267AB|nr:C-type lectin domain family 4 member F-like isoform X2 [Thalassophryne amazonica]
MSEELYTTIDFSKKVRFQAGKKEDNILDESITSDGVTVYDNYVAPKLQDKSTEDQQKAASVTAESAKKNRVFVAGVFLVTEDKRNWNIERTQFEMKKYNLTKERDDLVTNNSQLESLMYNLTKERDDLQTNNSQLQTFNYNLTENMSQLVANKEKLEVINRNLTQENNELQTNLSKALANVCTYGNSFGGNCYFFSIAQKNWYDSKAECEKHGAHLVTISNKDEQQFITSKASGEHWIGFTDEEEEGTWKWVNGEPLNTMYWRTKQPDNYNNNEDCATVVPHDSLNNWNDLDCQKSRRWICEKEINK